MEANNCLNRHNHISAFTAYDREKCPYCGQCFVLKPEYLRKLQEVNIV